MDKKTKAGTEKKRSGEKQPIDTVNESAIRDHALVSGNSIVAVEEASSVENSPSKGQTNEAVVDSYEEVGALVSGEENEPTAVEKALAKPRIEPDDRDHGFLRRLVKPAIKYDLVVVDQKISKEEYSGPNLVRAKFSNTEFDGCVFKHIDLAKSQVRACYFLNASFADVQFTKASLQGSYFLNCSFFNVDFRAADLSRAKFENCAFDAVSFENATLELTSFATTDLDLTKGLSEWSLSRSIVAQNLLLPDYISEQALQKKKQPRPTYRLGEILLGNILSLVFFASGGAALYGFIHEDQVSKLSGSLGLVLAVLLLTILSKHLVANSE